MARTAAVNRASFAPEPLPRRSVMRSARTATGPAGVSITLCPPRKRAMNSVAGFSNKLAWRRRLLDAALVHHDHEVGQRQRLVLAVRDMDEGDVELPLEAAKLGAHAHA